MSLPEKLSAARQRLTHPTWTNLWFPICWSLYLLAQAPGLGFSVTLIVGIFVAIILAVPLSAFAPPIWNGARNRSKQLQLVALLTAAGITEGTLGKLFFCANNGGVVQRALEAMPGGVAFGLPCVLAVVTVCALPSLFCLCTLFFSWIARPFLDWLRTFSWVEHGAALMVICMWVLLFSAWTIPRIWPAFHDIDIIFNMDVDVPLTLAYGTRFFNFFEWRAHIGHALFAVAAGPWVGAALFVGYALSWAVPWAPYVAVTCMQALAAGVGLLALGRLAGLGSAAARAGFIVWVGASFGLSIVVLGADSYAFGFMWLMVALGVLGPTFRRRGVLQAVAFVCAVGSLATSGLAVALSALTRVRLGARRWFIHLVALGACFGAALVVFGKLNAVLDVFRVAGEYNDRFSGAALTVGERVWHWLAFVGMTVRPPEAFGRVMGDGEAWWVAAPPSGAMVATGVAVLALTVACCLAQWRKPFMRLCLCWGGFSFLVLGVWGMGTAQNEQSLYVTHFAWAFLAPLAGGVAWAFGKLRLARVTPWVFLGFACVTAWMTVRAFVPMVAYLAEMWPR